MFGHTCQSNLKSLWNIIPLPSTNPGPFFQCFFCNSQSSQFKPIYLIPYPQVSTNKWGFLFRKIPIEVSIFHETGCKYMCSLGHCFYTCLTISPGSISLFGIYAKVKIISWSPISKKIYLNIFPWIVARNLEIRKECKMNIHLEKPKKKRVINFSKRKCLKTLRLWSNNKVAIFLSLSHLGG